MAKERTLPVADKVPEKVIEKDREMLAIEDLRSKMIEELNTLHAKFVSAVDEIQPQKIESVNMVNSVAVKLQEAMIGMENNTSSIMYPGHFEIELVKSSIIAQGKLVLMHSPKDEFQSKAPKDVEQGKGTE